MFMGSFQLLCTQFVRTNSSLRSPHCYMNHYNNVIMSALASQITSLTIVYSTIYSGANQRRHQSPASLAFVRRIHRWPVNSPHKGPVTRTMFLFDDVITVTLTLYASAMTIWYVIDKIRLVRGALFIYYVYHIYLLEENFSQPTQW